MTISSGARVYFKGDLSNSGTINCNGRLVVGTETVCSDGTTLITSNGTITNKGTINITTSAEALAIARSEPILEHSVYYAAITCSDLINGKTDVIYAPNANGVINMSDGSLIVQNDVTLYYASKMLFNAGTSYIDVWGNLTQKDAYYNRTDEEAIVKLNNNNTTTRVQINVREMYNDMTTLDNARTTHDWDLDNNQFTIDDRIELSVGSYYTASSEKLDEGVVNYTSITKDVYATDYSYVETEISDYTAVINNLNSDKASYLDKTSEAYQALVTIHGEDAPAVAADRVAQIEAEIASYQSIIDGLEMIKLFANDNISNAQLETLNTWFFNTDYGKWFIDQRNDNGGRIKIKSGKKEYTYYDYFYKDYIQNHNNHLKLYHYILAYMAANGNDAIYYDSRHNALSVMLPIELSYFEVAQDGNQIQFDWATESENNNDYFTVEYSLDGVNFNSVAVVGGAGNSTEQLVYNTTISAEKYEGIVYFRLKQTDFDGQSTYSEARVLYVQGADDGIVIYPNPATTTITIDGGEFSNVYFVDMQSKKYSAIELGGNQYSVENLSTGIYYAVITTAKGKALKKFIVTKSPVEK
ncbi:MAG: T9SS type A sorting domain-containing protein [Bacteroidales bacterium]|nr:T9SS type A sorting domain-containing protein [Bacteroidales bacterium]